MFFAPFPLIFSWLAGLLSLALLGGGVYLLLGWYVGTLIGTGYLVGGLLMVVWSALGRWVVLLFRRPAHDEPHVLRADSEFRLPREDGTNLYVERFGAAHGPTIVLTHGAGANRTSWYYVVRALTDRFQVLVWDMPGLGHSEKPRNGAYSLERHAKDLEAVLGLFPESPARLVGHSMGGMVLLTFCRLFPEYLGDRARGIALVDTSHTNPARTTTAAGFMRAIQRPILEPLLHVTAWLAPLVWLMSALGFAGTETRRQLDLAARYNVLAWPGVQARETLAMLHYDAHAVLGSIQVPTLVFSGHLDRLIVPETARTMTQQIPDAREVRLHPAGHMSVFERHDQLVAELEAFANCVLTGVPRTPVRAGEPA